MKIDVFNDKFFLRRPDYSNPYYSQEAFTRSKNFSAKIIKEASEQSKRILVFISHKHSDLDALKPLIAMFEKEYNVTTYVDSRDPRMPEVTNAETAKRIKEIIQTCNKFILLATNAAIESKWCNWELGYGDSYRFPKDIAIFPFDNNNNFKGNEYMKLYPHISYYYGNEKYTDGRGITEGYYVVVEDKSEGLRHLTPLWKWFNS